jgi:hypothetical protein
MASYRNPTFAGHELAMTGVSAGASQEEQRQGGHDENDFEHVPSINCIAANASLLQTFFVNG